MLNVIIARIRNAIVGVQKSSGSACERQDEEIRTGEEHTRVDVQPPCACMRYAVNCSGDNDRLVYRT